MTNLVPRTPEWLTPGMNQAVQRALVRAISSPDYEDALAIMEEELAIEVAAAAGAVAKEQLNAFVAIKMMENLPHLYEAYVGSVMRSKEIAVDAMTALQDEATNAGGTFTQGIVFATASCISEAFEVVRGEFSAALQKGTTRS